MITCDRAFLDKVVHKIVELDVVTDRAETSEGGYSAYREAQGKHRRRLEEDIARTAEQALRTELTTHDDKARRYAKMVARKAKARERRLRREMLSARWVERPEERPPLVLDFAARSDPATDVLVLDDLAVQREGRLVREPFSKVVRGGERVLVTGENGAGKSTLLQALAGELPAAQGSVRVAGRIGILPRVHDGLPLDLPVIDGVARSRCTRRTPRRCSVGTLSAGEIRRLLLAGLVNSGADLLLLDEPTNYLDLESLDVLEAALAASGGTVVAVGHDERLGAEFRPDQRWQVRTRAARCRTDIQRGRIEVTKAG